MLNYIIACQEKPNGAVLYPVLYTHAHMFAWEVSRPFASTYTIMCFLLHIG